MIPLLAIDEAKKRGTEGGLPEALAGVNAFRALLHNQKVASAVGKLLTTLLFENSLDARLRELVILRTGWRTASEYEFCQHVGVSRRLKISEQDILGVRNPETCASYNELDRAVIAMTDELLDDAEVKPETWATLERHLPIEHLIELIVAAGNWRLFATFLKTAKVPLDPGVPSWPEGKKPL